MATNTLQKPYIGIKKVWYGDEVTTVTSSSGYTPAELKALLATLTEIQNLHQDTWGYEESDADVTEYINELTGQPYYRDVTRAETPTISFTLGQYAFADKAALQGGEAIVTGSGNSAAEIGWQRKNMTELITKCIVAQTKTGNYIFLPKANIVAKGNFVDKNIGLGVTAVPLETNVEGLASEIWFTKEAVDNA